jgi:hypothetical protein
MIVEFRHFYVQDRDESNVYANAMQDALENLRVVPVTTRVWNIGGDAAGRVSPAAVPYRHPR